MGIAPVTKLGIPGNVFPSDVKSADISDCSVDDYNLSVVAVVDTQIQPSQQSGKEYSHLYACLFQLFPPFLRHKPAAHAVIENPDFYSVAYPIN